MPTDKKAQVANQKNTEQQEEIDAQIGTCPICNTGKIVDKGKLYGCTNYKADELCTFSLPKKWSEKNLGKTAIKDLITKGQTTKLKGFKSKKLVRSLTPN
ncbi:topoisomerase C-terminal repeat-containing protein [Leuconostoc citreum]|uniref:topoisomerase C-terminal repeat-containing protein n=1 Tax=Leuconostoc citreum TaxID=33964 RepID=UPI003D7F9FFA